MFIGRENELIRLKTIWSGRGVRLVLLYGGHGVGKTALMRVFCKGKTCVYWCAPEAPSAAQLDSFLGRLGREGAESDLHESGDKHLLKSKGWSAAFSRAFDECASDDLSNDSLSRNIRVHEDCLSAEGKSVVVLNEFSRVVRQDSAALEGLHAAWESAAPGGNVMLVLCEPDLGFAEQELLSANSVLHGCITDVIRLDSLSFWKAAKFFPRYSPEERTLAYAIFGGMPRHLSQCDPENSLDENVVQLALRKDAVFHDEAEVVVRREFREPARYNGILWAMARGAAKVSEIARLSSLSMAKASVYLQNLIDVGIVERELPMNVGSEMRSSNSRRGRYRIVSNFLRFLYSFVLPNMSDLEMGDARGVWEQRIEPFLWRFAAEPTRQMCADWLRRGSLEGPMPFRCIQVGAWWDLRTWIDVVGVDESGDRVIAGEIDLSGSPVGFEMYWRLVEKAAALTVPEKHYVLFSRGGFDSRLVQFAKNDDSLKLVSLGDLYE